LKILDVSILATVRNAFAQAWLGAQALHTMAETKTHQKLTKNNLALEQNLRGSRQFLA
jgi:hypothetical protein